MPSFLVDFAAVVTRKARYSSHINAPDIKAAMVAARKHIEKAMDAEATAGAKNIKVGRRTWQVSDMPEFDNDLSDITSVELVDVDVTSFDANEDIDAIIKYDAATATYALVVGDAWEPCAVVVDLTDLDVAQETRAASAEATHA